jgi:DNA-binding NarL/FixJ family response regulator
MSTRILIADDHQMIRSGLRSVLEAQPGWEIVSEADDGWKAVAQAVLTRPDIAVIDYMLPALNGIEVTRQIRAMLPKTEVLIFTLHEDVTLMAEAMEAGARGFVLKSDVNDSLVSAVTALSGHRPFFPAQLTEKLAQRRKGRIENAHLLSPRERLVMQLIASGLTNRAMARRLDLSIKTIESHRASAMRKIGASSTADVIRYALRNKLVEF